MSSRIEIELTSKQNETTWTWRAAGAKQPKGTIEASLLYEDAKVGDICRAEAEFEVDGISIVMVTPPQSKRDDTTKRISVIGPQREFKAVTSQLAPKRGRSDKPRRKDRDRLPTEGRAEKQPRRAERSAKQREQPARPPAPVVKKLNPKDEHRQRVLTDLAPEHRPIAEQVLRGGILAVRKAIEDENAKAKAEGRPELNAAALLEVAESILPQLRAAEWQDKAEAAKLDVNEISLRDLRAVVAGADAVARTDETRVLAAELREHLDRRNQEARDTWLKDISSALDDGRVVRALRLSARPPDAQVKFPTELNERLTTLASEAMSPECAPDRWSTLLDAVANSPIRRSVEPKGLPENPGEELLNQARQAAGRIPALAKQLGVVVPPPPTKRPPKPPKPNVVAAEAEATKEE